MREIVSLNQRNRFRVTLPSSPFLSPDNYPQGPRTATLASKVIRIRSCHQESKLISTISKRDPRDRLDLGIQNGGEEGEPWVYSRSLQNGDKWDHEATNSLCPFPISLLYLCIYHFPGPADWPLNPPGWLVIVPLLYWGLKKKEKIVRTAQGTLSEKSITLN